jgi:large subunit ribosomal protein L32
MGAVPKFRISKSRGRKRRTHWKIEPEKLTTCSWCGEPKRPHHVCLSCGTYRGKQILEIEEE